MRNGNRICAWSLSSVLVPRYGQIHVPLLRQPDGAALRFARVLEKSASFRRHWAGVLFAIHVVVYKLKQAGGSRGVWIPTTAESAKDKKGINLRSKRAGAHLAGHVIVD